MLKIAITGPESSGKTTLCSALSDHFNVPYIPEYARSFLKAKKQAYKQTDLDLIAMGQINSLQSFTNSPLISDTDFCVLEIWSQYKYQHVSDLIKELVAKDFFDLHILCTPDMPWEDDELRENPNSRMHLFELYKATLLKHNKNHIIVNGDHIKRVEKSIRVIEEYINI